MSAWTDLELSKSGLVKALHRWWTGARRQSGIPDRADLDPVVIKPLLPNLLIAEAEHHPFRVRYRLVGTTVVAFAGMDFTGRYLDTLVHGRAEEPWPDHYLSAYQTRQPVFGRATDPTTSGGKVDYEFGIFPLALGGSAVAQFVAAEDYFGRELTSTQWRQWAVQK